MSEALARHHIFSKATQGQISCVACGRTYTLETGYQSMMDPCIYGPIPEITEEEAMYIWASKINEVIGLPPPEVFHDAED